VHHDSPPAIEPAEYQLRRRRLRAAIADRGLDGAVVVSRGSHGGEWGADVLYLTNHYTPFCQLPDYASLWRGRGHAVYVTRADGEDILVVDIPDWRTDLVVADDVRVGLDLWAEVTKAVKALGLDAASLGLIGSQTLPHAGAQRFMGELPGATFTWADEVLEVQRRRKSDAEVALCRHATKVGCEITNAFMEAAVEGATEGDCVAAGLSLAARRGALSWDMPVASGPNVDHFQWERLPSWNHTRRLEVGDMIHPDIYGSVNGYMYDMIRSRVVGRDPNAAEQELIDGAIGVIQEIVAGVRPGVSAAELFARGDTWLKANGFDATPGSEAAEDVAFLAQSFPAFGHGIGLSWERPWISATDDLPLEQGMILAFEAQAGRPGVGTAAFEHNVLVTEDGVEVLTTDAKMRW
jgi:Xaa-Pro aminopeptidase